MTVYPFAIDDDSTILRIDDNIQELGDQSINQLREAVFALETELGIQPSGTLSSVADRLDVALNPNGTIKASALTSVGLVALPITNSQVGTNAGIAESKLALTYSTSNLNTSIAANAALINSLVAFTNETDSDLNTHVAGGALLGDGSPARHVASHIDLNAVPSDARDGTFSWSGLLDKDGAQRTATNVASGLAQVNDALTSHENATASAHVATAIDIDTTDFEEIPQTVDTLQKFADWSDDFNRLTLGEHRAVQHDNAIPKIARSQDISAPDGYRENIVPVTPVQTYLVRSPNTSPVDDIAIGDNVIRFVPTDNSTFTFDEAFGRVQSGDEIRVNYANGLEAKFYVDSIRFVPGTEWVVRINGINLADSDGYALARIDRAQYDPNTSGVLAVASANATPTGSFDTILSSLIVGHPRGATAVGIGFDPGQLDATHYNLYLELYPTGNPADRVISLPAVDVTGNAGTTPGQYTLDGVVQSTNQRLREIGYNYRMIAFAHDGEFGIMMADVINNASFSIIKGINSSGSLAAGTFSNNVIGEATDTFDALGLGSSKGDVAGVAYIASFTDGFSAQINTKIIPPLRRRNYIVNGRLRDTFADTWMANDDGYWDGYISSRTTVGAFTVETTYTVFSDLEAAGLKAGKTIVVQPTVDFSDGSYFDVDYGRFIIKDVNFVSPCPGDPPTTLITVINGIHATGNGFGFSSGPSLPVRLYFGEDSVGFNNEQLRATTPTSQDYRRHHEVFIDEEGKTFAHERLRMPVQSQTGTLLGTSSWHITDVSPKLAGYRDDATSFEKYIRFYILSYDTDTGEYDGYIGQRVPSSDQIISTGPITTGRKDVVTRFYDESHIDYVDLIFDEEAINLATETVVLSDGVAGGGGTPRYVDFEVFGGLRTQDELLLLATCEVNWDPSSGQEIVQRVVGRRQFGSVAEDDFTDSALAYINAGDRYLHENGVVRGLDFDSVGTDPRELSFKGGIALVNGVKAFVNAQSVTIPEISENLAGTPDIIDWAVCVNEDGGLIPILITPTKQQFFAIENTGGATFYVPSVTFTELVETRKDLTPIYTLSATIASFTLTAADVKDVRRFVVDSGRTNDLVVAADGYVGNFATFGQLANWVNAYATEAAVKVKVRGEFTLTSEVTFANNYPIIFEGDGAVVHVKSPKGFVLNDNLTFRNMTFNYNPDTSGITFIDQDKVAHANGCIHSNGSRSNIIIEDCVFNSDFSRQRPPFISFEIDNEEVVESIKIAGNVFNDNGGSGPIAGGTNDATLQAAIGIVHLDESVASGPSTLYRVRIENNICSQFQGIFILQNGANQASAASSLSGPGIASFDVVVSDNNCGAIGFLTSANEPTSGTGDDTNRTAGITIERNTAAVIGHMANHSQALSTTLPGTRVTRADRFASTFPIGRASIVNNNCSLIALTAAENAASGLYCRINVDGNKVVATDGALVESWGSGQLSAGGVQSFGIAVVSGFSSDDPGEVKIVNNTVSDNVLDATAETLINGITTTVSGEVMGNTIQGFSGFGIAAQAAPLTYTRRFIVKGNRIFRDTSTSITQYIFLDTDDDDATGICTDNIMNSPFIDSGGTDDETINGTGTGTPLLPHGNGWVVERNINQTDAITIRPGGGGSVALGLNSESDYIAAGALETLTASRVELGIGSGTNAITCHRAATDSASIIDFAWMVPLVGSIPSNARLISVAATFTPDATPATTSTGTVNIRSSAGNENNSQVGITTAGATVTTTASLNHYARTSFDARAEIIYTINDAGGAIDTTINAVLTYRW